jgi:hypothetical protein
MVALVAFVALVILTTCNALVTLISLIAGVYVGIAIGESISSRSRLKKSGVLQSSLPSESAALPRILNGYSSMIGKAKATCR